MNEQARFIADMLGIIEPDIGQETGKDDFVYGSYVAWSDLDSQYDDVIESLLEYFQLQPLGTKEENILLLRDRGVPEETVYESPAEMDHYPDWAKCWAPDPEDYLFYKEHGLEYLEYTKELSNIEDKMGLYGDDDIANKALILAALVLTESLVKSVIVESIPDLNVAISDASLRNMVQKDIDRKLRSNEGRKSIYKEFYESEKLKDTPYNELRNTLAHDIWKPEIKNGQIIFDNTSLDNTRDGSSTESADVLDIFVDLKSFAQGLSRKAALKYSGIEF